MATETSTIRVLADTAQAERALGSLHSQLAGIGKIVVAGAIVHQFNKIAEGIEDIGKAAQKFNISSAAMDALGQSAQLAGVDFGDLTAALSKFQQNLGDALIKNTGPAAAGLAMLGLRASELANLPVPEQLIRIKNAMSGIENPALRSAIAVDILGKNGAKLLKVSEDAERLEKRFRNLGLALSDVDTQGVENALDRVDEVIQVVEQGFKKLVANIAPYVEAAASAILFIVDNFGGPMVTALSAATRAVIAFLAVLAVGKTVAAINLMVTGFVNLQKAIKGAATAQAAFNLLVGANPIIRIATIVAGIAAIFGGPLLDAASKLLGIEEETAKQVAERKRATEGDAEAAARALRIRQLVLDLEENIVPQIQEQVRLMQVKNNLGDVAYETEKQIGEQAKKYNISLDEARSLVEGRVGALNAELALQNKISEAVQAGTQRVDQGPQGYDLAGIKKAIQNRDLALQTSNEKARMGTQLALNEEIAAYASKLDQEYSLQTEHTARISALDDFAHTLRMEGYSTESDEYRALLYAKETAFSQHIQKLVEMDRQRFEQSKFMELQGQQYSQFGYDTKKAMAREAADFEMKSDMEKSAFALDQASQMFGALGAQNKKAFEAAKAFNIANAVMNTYLSVTKSLAMYPFPFNLVAAGASLAMGMAQVAQIRSQSYSGRALGGPVMGGQTYMVGENGPELFTPSTTGSITRNDQLGSGGATINFNIQANDASGFDALLMERRGMITQFVRDAMQENGQRSRI